MKPNALVMLVIRFSGLNNQMAYAKSANINFSSDTNAWSDFISDWPCPDSLGGLVKIIAIVGAALHDREGRQKSVEPI